jgi:hypothetical protein
MQKLQNRMMQTILRSRLDTPIRNMLETLNYLALRQRVTCNTMVLLYKMEKNLLPDYLHIVSSSHSHNPRSGEDFMILRYSSILFLANNSDLSYLQKLQNQMMRTRSRLDTPIRNIQHNGAAVQNGLFPDYFYASSHSHNTRNSDDFMLPNFRKASTQDSLMYIGL